MKLDPEINNEEIRQEFDILFRENKARMYNAAYGVTGDKENAEDAMQRVFLHKFEKLPSAEFIRNPQGYLWRAAFYEALNVVREHKRLGLDDVDVDELEIAAPEPATDDAERLEALRVALSTMKPEQVELLNLRYIQNCSCDAIAERQDKLATTVWVQLCRARVVAKKKILRIVEKQHEGQENKRQRGGPAGIRKASRS